MVKFLVALAVAVSATVTPCLFDALTPIDRVAAGCSQVRESNGGPVILVKIHDNPTVWDTQFVNGTVRWEINSRDRPNPSVEWLARGSRHGPKCIRSGFDLL